MRHRWLLLTALVLPCVGACAGTSTASKEPAVVAATTTPVAVGVADFKFSAPHVQVPVGGSVVWTNNDTQPHTATSAGAFDAGAIQPGKTAAVTFPTAGTFTYICSFHPFMTGTVTVG